MKNKLVFLLVFLFVIGFVSAASSVKLNLSKTNYAGDELFEGILVINNSAADISENVVADITDCGSYSEKSIKLYKLLVDAGIYSGAEREYTEGAYATSLTGIFEGTNEKLFGFFVNEEIDKVKFDISGASSNVFLDVGNDGINDWKYLGGFTGWDSTVIHSLNYPGNYELSPIVEYNPNNEVCDEFNVSFENLTSSLNLNITAFAKSSGAGVLTAKIGTKSCVFGSFGSAWSNQSCNITIDVSNSNSPKTFEVCLQANNNNIRIPQRTGVDFHYISLKQAIYNNQLTPTAVSVSDSRIKEAMENYYEANCEEWCVIPLRLNAVSPGSYNLNNLVLEFGSSTSSYFYEISSESVKLNLTDEEIDLKFFNNLKTPDVNKEQSCTLEVKYGSKKDDNRFSMSIGPTPIINIGSQYVGKNVPVIFDGTSSRGADGKNVSSYSWDFGDSTTSQLGRVSHTFTSYDNYNVKLTVKGSNNVESSKEIIIYVLPLEDYLNSEFTRINKTLANSTTYLNSRSGEIKEFVEFMDYKNRVNQIKTRIGQLKTEFNNVKASTSTTKDTNYSNIANEIVNMTQDIVTYVQSTGSINVKNLALTDPAEIFSYSGRRNMTEGYKNSLYNFNGQNVNVDANIFRYYVTSLAGNNYFVYVKKTISVDGGKNNVAVEDLRLYDVDKVYTNLTKDSSSKVIYKSLTSSPSSFSYAIKDSLLEEIKTIVFSDVKVENELYCYTQANNCQSYCGDGTCDIINEIDETDEGSNNYCEVDCSRGSSTWKYVILIGFFFLVLVYLFLYKGPGSFKHLSNRLTYWMINRNLFMSEKDRLNLNQFVINAFKKGYNEIQIRQILLKKGWNNKQIDAVMENYIKRKY
nr:hypothetical protein [Nanoarchaeum sp.]